MSADEGYVNWNVGFAYCYRNWLKVNGQLTDASGIPLANVPVTIEVFDADTYAKAPKATFDTKTTFYTDASGELAATDTILPTSIGAQQFYHTYSGTDYYDNAMVTVYVNGTKLYSTPVYGYAYNLY